MVPFHFRHLVLALQAGGSGVDDVDNVMINVGVLGCDRGLTNMSLCGAPLRRDCKMTSRHI